MTMAVALSDERLTASGEITVLAVLAYHEEADAETIAKESRMCRQTFEKHINSLIELGYVIREESRDDAGRFSQTVYKLVMPQTKNSTADKGMKNLTPDRDVKNSTVDKTPVNKGLKPDVKKNDVVCINKYIKYKYNKQQHISDPAVKNFTYEITKTIGQKFGEGGTRTLLRERGEKAIRDIIAIWDEAKATIRMDNCAAIFTHLVRNGYIRPQKYAPILAVAGGDNRSNFEQRKYGKEYYNSLYEEV